MSKKKHLRLFLAGSGIGIANLIPGISGATIALFFGLYEKLLDSLTSIIKNPFTLKKQLSFLLPILLGAILGIASFSYIIDFSLRVYPNAFKLLLLFCVSTQIPCLWTRYSSHFKTIHYPFLVLITALVGFLSFVFLGIQDPNMHQAPNHVLIASGFFGASALVLPGLSGSLIFVLMGTYSIIIDAIKSFNALVLFLVSLGALLGLGTTAFSLRWLIKHMPAFCYVCIFGLVFGAFVPLWPNTPVITFHSLATLSSLLGLFVGIYSLKKHP